MYSERFCREKFLNTYLFCFALFTYKRTLILNLQRDKVPLDYATREPDHRQIYRFIRTLFSSAQLTAECAIVTLVSCLYFVKEI